MKNKSNTKVLWYILFAIVTVVLCYLFIVVYFYCISPWDISLKLTFWPFLSESTMGEVYSDCVVEINFKVKEDFDSADETVYGVNVRKDGFIVAPFEAFRKLDETQSITIKLNSGTIFNGKLLYSDSHFNLSILKCENMQNTEEEVKIPFVKIKTLSEASSDFEIFAVSLSGDEKTSKGSLEVSDLSNLYKQTELDGFFAVDFVLEDCPNLILDKTDFSDGVIFDNAGFVVGFEQELQNNNYAVRPIESVSLFIDEVAKSYYQSKTYTNLLVDSVIGLDFTELSCHMLVSQNQQSDGHIGNSNGFYFNGQWNNYSETIQSFYDFCESGDQGFFLMSDFVYNDQVLITKDCRIDSLIVNGTMDYVTPSKNELYNVLYTLQSEDEVDINFKDMKTMRSSVSSFVV